MKLVRLLPGNIIITWRRKRIFKQKRKTKKDIIISRKPIYLFEESRSVQDLERIVQNCRDLLSIPENVEISVKWGRKAKRVLGSVRLVKGSSVIRISRYLSDFKVPEYVLEEVILHELIHVKTGHGSTLEKQYEHAHRGGVIRKEMAAVGKAELFDNADKWVKTNWINHVRNYNRRETLYNKKENAA